MLRIGPYEIHAIETGRFRLDGGAMFGVVPKVLWENQAPPDQRNRIQLAMRVILAMDRSAGRAILVDTGAGCKWDDEEIDRFAFEIQEDKLGRTLKQHGLCNDDITDVIITHLHFDHNGGLTEWEEPGTGSTIQGAAGFSPRGPSIEDFDTGSGDRKLRPRFRRARHWVHAEHLAHALSPAPKDRASFYERDFKAVEEAGLFEQLEGETPASPFANICWFVTHGHTPHQLLPRFYDDQSAAQYMADLIPTSAHLPLPWVMAYDNEPLKTIEEKRRVLHDCDEQDLILLFEHDPQIAAARVDVSGKRPAVKQIIDV